LAAILSSDQPRGRETKGAEVGPAYKQPELVEPFLKWAGGKRWLFRRHRHLFPNEIETLIDPFLGGGSSFFCLRPRRAILSDVNRDIICLYLAIRANPIGIAQRLIKYQRNHSRNFYYETRKKKPSGRDELAAWLLYLNRTCWNGLFRVNLDGTFNVPIGTKTKVFIARSEFGTHAAMLENAELHAWDFERTIAQAGRGDVVFADPPYFENGSAIRFVKYNSDIFVWADQQRLKRCLSAARDRGARVYLTNSNHSSLVTLYSDVGLVHVVKRHSVLSGHNKGRGPSTEILIEFK
jgi:DNA adenine methylase